MAGPPQRDQLFGRLLLHYELLTKDQLVEALQKQSREGGKRRIGEILIADGLITRERFERLLEIQKELQERMKTQTGSSKTEGASDPDSLPDSGLTGLPIPEPNVGDAELGPLVEEPGPSTLPAAESDTSGAPTAGSIPAPETPSSPVAAVAADLGEMGRLLLQAVQTRASDLHLHVGAPIGMRRLGTLDGIDERLLVPADTERLLGEVLSPEQKEDLETTGQVDFSYTLSGVGRFRVNAYRQQKGTDAVFRVIPPEPPSLTDLGLPLDLARFANFHQGMVLITGPSGCGKSSTMNALIRIINDERRDHVITIEDPVEHVHRSRRAVVNQRQVGPHTRSFSRALRAALREDPDIIAVGELRDLETISLALTAAETGHLVLATLHTTNAITTINRVIGVFPPDQQPQVRTMVSESLRAILSQRLVPRADGEGRVPAMEILVCNKAVSNLIRERKTFQIASVMQTGTASGMRSLDASLEELVEAGTVTAEEAARHAEDPKRFAPKSRAPTPATET